MSTASLFQNRLLFVSSKQVIKDTGFLNQGDRPDDTLILGELHKRLLLPNRFFTPEWRQKCRYRRAVS